VSDKHEYELLKALANGPCTHGELVDHTGLGNLEVNKLLYRLVRKTYVSALLDGGSPAYWLTPAGLGQVRLPGVVASGGLLRRLVQRRH
jgi:DNA-binding IclR family transcriptional regulator